MARTGRPQRPYQPVNGGSPIVGLYRTPGSNRWKITVGEHAGERFTESDEQLAIARFLAKRSLQTIPYVDNSAGLNVTLPSDPPTTEKKEHEAQFGSGDERLKRDFERDFGRQPRNYDPAVSSIVFTSPTIRPTEYWADLRKLLINEPELCAKMTGIPGLRTAATDIPKPSLSLQKLIDLYDDKSDSSKNTKSHARTDWARMTKFTGAKTVEDLTTEVLKSFRQHIVESGIAPSGAGQIFGKIKATIAFALKYGEDADQLTALLVRMKVLYPPKSTSKPEPKPISPENFRTLLKGIDDEWRLMCLLGLNAALYIEDLCELRWDEIDLEAKTFKSVRKKTGVARVAMLWDETIEALKKWPHRANSPFIFTSSHGRRFNCAGRYNTYKKVRERAKVTDSFSSLRDAAYTCAVQNCEERYARVLAGHRSPGLQDSYVLRNPQFVKPATDAIYKHFGPFPKQSAGAK